MNTDFGTPPKSPSDGAAIPDAVRLPSVVLLIGLCGVLAVATLSMVLPELTGLQRGYAVALLVFGLLVLAGLLGQRKGVTVEESHRALDLNAQRIEAQRQRDESKRINDANQAAILRLMNELQLVAEGDLTQQATVTEDITGAIADSVNYTVEELRTLVAQVQALVRSHLLQQ
jgi:twitching motility protein PilJ